MDADPKVLITYKPSLLTQVNWPLLSGRICSLFCKGTESQSFIWSPIRWTTTWSTAHQQCSSMQLFKIFLIILKFHLSQMKGSWLPLNQFDDALQYKILQLIAMFRNTQLLSCIPVWCDEVGGIGVPQCLDLWSWLSGLQLHHVVFYNSKTRPDILWGFAISYVLLSSSTASQVTNVKCLEHLHEYVLDVQAYASHCTSCSKTSKQEVVGFQSQDSFL